MRSPRSSMPFIAMRSIAFALAACLMAQQCAAAWSGRIGSTLWTLQAANGKDRWLEIHNLNSQRLDGLYHVQILERSRSDLRSIPQSLADHMAITEGALRASILAPRNSGSMYPERYDSAYAAWQAAKAQGQTFVCDTNVVACLAAVRN